jgi:hypothetical protein
LTTLSLPETCTGTLRERIAAEYHEMPGLSLTLEQACRLWHLDRASCLRTLRELIDEKALRQTADGHYCRKA